jgi:hypothetical protein
MFVAFEYLKIISTVEFRALGLRYLSEIRRFRRTHPGVRMLVAADSLLRGMVEHDLVENPTLQYAEAFTAVLDGKQYLWGSAVAEVESTRHPAAKRERDVTPPRKTPGGGRANAAASSPAKPPQKKQRQGRPSLQAPTKASTAATGPARARISEKEWLLLTKWTAESGKDKHCRFFNSSVGCHDKRCRFTHKCVVCGAPHAAATAHQS